MNKIAIFFVALFAATAAHAQLVLPGGGSGSGGSGVTSIATSCGSSGGTITTTGTIRGKETAEVQTGANYAFVDADCGKFKILSNGSNQVPTLGAIGSGTLLFADGGVVDVCNQGAGTQTLTPTTSTIGGAATYVLAAGTVGAPSCVTLVADLTNTNYQVIPYGGASVSGANPSATAGPAAVNGSATTYMRSDGAPPIQKGSNAQFGLAEGDGASIDLTAGVVSRRALTGDVTASAGSGATTLAAGSASNLNSGTLPAGRMPALTGDCTTSAGAVATTCAGIMAPQYILNNWYLEYGGQGISATTNALSSNTAYFSAIFFPTLITINSLEVGTITGNGNCRVGLFAPDVTTKNRPGALVGQSASTSVSASSTIVTAAFLSNPQVQGRYFKVVACDNATVTFSGPSTQMFFTNQIFGSATNTSILNAGSNSQNLELSVAWTYANGAFPSSMAPAGSTCGTGAQACTYTEVKGGTRVPFFGYQVTSIP